MMLAECRAQSNLNSEFECNNAAMPLAKINIRETIKKVSSTNIFSPVYIGQKQKNPILPQSRFALPKITLYILYKFD
jgi:hypothetical protein